MNTPNILKDLFNQQVRLDGNYSKEELLAYMSICKNDEQYFYYHVLKTYPKILDYRYIIDIIKHVKLYDNKNTFHTITEMLKPLNAYFDFDYDAMITDTKKGLLNFNIDYDDLDIKLFFYIYDDRGNIYNVFKLNDQYFCNFNQLYYCPIEKSFYDYIYGHKIFYNAKYYINKQMFRSISVVYDDDRKGLRFSSSNNWSKEFTDSIKIYRFDYDDQFNYDKAEKIYYNDRLLFSRLYKKYLVANENT